MSTRSILSRWQSEYYAPVVVTVATADVERICLENGLLFHELLSAFGHIDSVNGNVRSGGQNFPIPEANIRFERISEVVHKNSGVIEEHLREYFEEFDIKRLPGSLSDLRASPPSAWTSKVEQLLMYSISFSEFEMASHPLVFLTVVSSTDDDPMACARELSSTHHMPPCFFTGQYDLEVQRAYVIVHDNSSTKPVDINKLLTRMQAAVSPANVYMLHLNSLSVQACNMHQPDLWSQSLHPLFFPQHAPYLNTSLYKIAVDPVSGSPVKGSRLSLEDFIALRTFCQSLFTQDVLPSLERRLATLSRQVNESRKGVKNVLKSFWRKPREEGAPAKGQAKYRIDRTEAQILLLADTSFVIKDYETASAMYRLVRDDFRADKSTSHLAHTTVMAAVCQLAGEPPAGFLGASSVATAAAVLRSAGHHREVCAHLEILTQCITSSMEPSYSAAVYAVLAAELHTSPSLVPSVRAPLEAAQIVLQAAASLTKFPLLCALLTEKAAEYFLQAGQFRRFAFHEVLAGHKFHTCGLRPKKHAIVCFAAAMVIHEAGRWGSVKVKLNRAIADELVNVGEDPCRALVLLLRIVSLGSVISGGGIDSKGVDVVSRSTAHDIMLALKDLCAGGPWGTVLVAGGWKGRSIRQMLLGDTPVNIAPPGQPSRVDGLPVPEVVRSSSEILSPLNGSQFVAGTRTDLDRQAISQSLSAALAIEREWAAKRLGSHAGSRSLAALLMEDDAISLTAARVRGSGPRPHAVVPLGETLHVQIEINNRLHTQLVLSDMSLHVCESGPGSGPGSGSDDCDHMFDAKSDEVVLPANSVVKVILTAVPKQKGKFRLSAVRWNIGSLCVYQPLQKDGLLLQKTLAQRCGRERGEDTSLDFEVGSTQPLLQLQFESVVEEVLQGEVTRCFLRLTNEGRAAAKDICLKFSHPFFLVDFNADATDLVPVDNSVGSSDVFGNGVSLDWLGCASSATTFELPANTQILPGRSLRVGLWMCGEGGGMQRLSVLAEYSSGDSDQNTVMSDATDGTAPIPTPPAAAAAVRTSMASTSVLVLPSLGLSLRCIPRPNEPLRRTMVLELCSFISTTTEGPPVDYKGASGPSPGVDGVLAVDSVRLIGGARVQSSSCAGDRGKWEARHSERLTMCIPVEITESIVRVESVTGSDAMAATWSLSNYVSWSMQPSANFDPGMLDVLGRIMCMSYASQRLNSELYELRNKKKVASPQPTLRSIQSVRRENRASSSNSVSSLSSSVKDEGPVSRPSVVAKSAASAVINTVGGVTTSSHELLEPSVSGLAEAQAVGSSVTVAVAWMCRWRGRICRGTHFVFGVPMFSHPMSSHLPTAGRMVAADYLSVSIVHPSKAALHCTREEYPSRTTGTSTMSAQATERSALVSVEVELKSMGEQVLVAWVDALDWERGQDLEILAPKKNVISGEDILSPNSPTQSCRWLGKVRYEAVRIGPYEKICIPFVASFTKSGIYDLKSFRVTVDFAQDNFSTPSVKLIHGQSLIDVVD